MNRIIILFTLLLFNSPLFAQWTVLNEGPGVRDIMFTSEDVGYMTGGEMLMKTMDGGVNWQSIRLPQDLYFTSVNFINDSIGLAQGFSQTDDNRIFRSDDGGLSWQGVHSLPYDGIGLFQNNFVFITDSLFLRLIRNGSSNRRLTRSTDAGESWTDVSLPIDPGYDLPVFINRTVGFISSDSGFLRSTDGGYSWNKMFNNGLNIRSMQFVNDSTGYLGHYNNADDNYVLYVSSDTGRSWSPRYSTARYEWISVFSGLSEDTLFAVFNDTTTGLKVSNDGGRNWSPVRRLAHEWYYRILTFNSDGRGYLLADLGSGWYGYEGAMVLEGSPSGVWRLRYSGYPIKTVWFSDAMHGFAGGGASYPHWTYGDILRTSDGGRTWEVNFTLQTPITEIRFFDENNGIALASGSYGSYLLKTTDGGDTWSRLPENYPDIDNFSLEDAVFFFNDEQQGWLAGRYNDGAAILSTINGGQNWDLAWSNHDPNENIRHGFNKIKGRDSITWAVGENGLLVRSNANGAFSHIEINSNLPLKGLYPLDAQTCWIAGGYSQGDSLSSVVLKTTDGGETWQEFSFSSFLPYDIFFINNRNGWVVGEDVTGDGIILESSDGGETWQTVVDGLRGPLWNLFQREEELWASGAYGQILKSDGVSWTDPNSGKQYPEATRLQQNYPNPFNPKTHIEYRLTNNDFVTLSIYNMLGQKVATLVDEKQAAGSYKVQWDATGFSSGIYFYRLEIADSPGRAGQGRQKVKKLVLLK